VYGNQKVGQTRDLRGKVDDAEGTEEEQKCLDSVEMRTRTTTTTTTTTTTQEHEQLLVIGTTFSEPSHTRE
jgi:hypothetical protein